MEVRRDTSRYMAALALALSFAPSLMRRDRKEQLAISVGSAALGAAAGAATETVVVQLSRRFRRGEAAARLSIAAAGAVAAALRLDRRGRLAALIGTAARVAGIASLLGWVAPERRRVKGFDPLPLAAAGATAAGVTAVRAERKRRRRKKLDFPHDDYLATVSWGPGSRVDSRTLDFEGQRFLAGAAEGLRVDPVRVFVGKRSAENVALRCDLAVAELERLGAFDRRRIVVCSATLRGYVNPIPIAAEERLSDGDVAHVTVQYHDKRTPWLWRKVPVAAQTHRELMARLAAHPGAAEICVYGESLGAWASQRIYDDVADLERLRVERAMWVGTPYFSRLARRLRNSDDARIAFLRTRDLREGDPEGAERMRYVFLERLTDPVVLFPGVEMLWRRPAWQKAWRPGVSFIQGLVDLLKATAWTRDQPASEGHDYRIELPLTVNVAFGHLRDRDEVSRLGHQVLEEEAARLKRVRDARKASLSSGS